MLPKSAGQRHEVDDQGGPGGCELDGSKHGVKAPFTDLDSERRGRRRGRRQGRRDFGTVKEDRHSARGTPRFSAVWWEGGRQRRKRGFTKRGDAEAFLARIRTALADGVLQAHRRADVTLAVVASEWLTTHSAVRLRSHDDNEQRWKTIGEFFGASASLSDITPGRIMELRSRLRSTGREPATVNRYLALLRTVLNYAVTAGYLTASPVRRFGRGAYLLPEMKAQRSAPLASNDEAARLLAHVPPAWFPLFAFLLLTGARRGEAAGLRWEDIDFGRRLVTIRRSYDAPTKSGRHRTVPISADLAAVLARHRMRSSKPSGLVFPHPTRGGMMTVDVKLWTVLDDACKAAGVPRMRIHDLRHANASLWLMNGGTLTDVQHNLGHSSPMVTSGTYAHLAEDHRVGEADRRLALGLPQPGPRLVGPADAEAATVTAKRTT
ncbi:MAG TPA: tyrosine-type recombinase/integrase [Polyangia bacterium]|nr:tyrosine-type recombinase/integrase [Polyangia bacterium]